MIDRLLLLGAAGDLATRHLLPALAQLLRDARLPPTLKVSCLDREAMSGQGYRSLVESKLAEHALDVPAVDRAALADRLDYRRIDLQTQPNLRSVLHEGPVVAYLALPPSVYRSAVQALRAGGLVPGSRIVLEKPYGTDIVSARGLTQQLHTFVAERDIFRVDHFLYHQAVQDLLVLRFATPVFEPIWNHNSITKVEVIWEESSGTHGRTDFYDRTGALRDMIQSHLLQVLALVAMNAPEKVAEDRLREERVAVLRRIPALAPREVAGRTARGRYVSGSGTAGEMLSYVDEPGVDPSRHTETYAYIRLGVNVPRWRGVPFILRTGKALQKTRRSVIVHFRPIEKGPLLGIPAALRVDMSPDRLGLSLAAAGPTGLPDVQPVVLQVSRPRQTLPASARLMLDVLAGDPTLFVRADEAEECWRIVDSVLSSWRHGVPPMQDYMAGSEGPEFPPV